MNGYYVCLYHHDGHPDPHIWILEEPVNVMMHCLLIRYYGPLHLTEASKFADLLKLHRIHANASEYDKAKIDYLREARRENLQAWRDTHLLYDVFVTATHLTRGAYDGYLYGFILTDQYGCLHYTRKQAPPDLAQSIVYCLGRELPEAEATQIGIAHMVSIEDHLKERGYYELVPYRPEPGIHPIQQLIDELGETEHDDIPF